jgi:radical SAM protein with 4Fe4S-binding SPASM domain
LRALSNIESRISSLLTWPARRLQEGYRLADLPSLAAARLRGLSPEAWEEQLSARETAAQAEVLRSTPRTLFLEITGRCPIECLMCARRYRNWSYGDLDERTFTKLSRVLPRVGMVVLGGFGEPLAASSFDSYFDRLLGWGARVALQTSGYRLTEERAERLARGLRHLHISMDSPEEETYRSIRPRIAFREVTGRIRQMAAIKRSSGSPYPTIHVVFVAMRRNIEQLPAMVDFVAEMSADNLTVQYMVVHGEEVRAESLFYHQELANRMLDAAEERAREVGLSVTFPARFGSGGRGESVTRPGRPAGSPLQACTDPWTVAFVRWNGEVRPCCYAPSRVVMGNLAERSFWEIWNGPAYRDLRRRVNSADPPDYCHTCTVGRLCGVDDERAHVVLADPAATDA